MEFIILGSILLLRVVQSITGKSCSKLVPTEPRGMMAYMSIRMCFSALTAVVVLIIGGLSIEAVTNMPTLGWFIALATGIALTVSGICSLLAMRGASVALSALFGAAGLLVPTISGIFIFDQKVTVGQWAGILCLFIAALLLASSSGKTNGKITVKTVLLLLGSMLTNGSVMLLQTLYKAFVPEGNVSVYSFFQFAIPAVILFVVSFSWSKYVKEAYPKTKKNLLGYTFFASAAVFGVSQLSTIASGFIPIAVLFPISDGGNTIIAAVVAAIMFREKMSKRTIFGVLIGVAGLVMIKLLSI